MLENVTTFFRKIGKKEQVDKSKDAAKERLHLVLMQDRANVSADFLDMMKQEIVDVIKKYIDVDENEMNVKLENRTNTDGTTGAPALYANIPIVGINEEKKKESEELTKTKKQTKATSKTAKELATKKTATRKATTKKKLEADVETDIVAEKNEEKVKKTVSAKKSTTRKKKIEEKEENDDKVKKEDKEQKDNKETKEVKEKKSKK